MKMIHFMPGPIAISVGQQLILTLACLSRATIRWRPVKLLPSGHASPAMSAL
jgi:hypothetical protein